MHAPRLGQDYDAMRMVSSLRLKGFMSGWDKSPKRKIFDVSEG